MSKVESIVLGEVKLSDSASVKVSRFKGNDGRDRIDIRLFVAGEKYSGATRKGVTIPVDKLLELVKVLSDTK
jgi:hypothetical protein